jgi:2-oxoglutarate ferredoxin oxidoreductase subunit beta
MEIEHLFRYPALAVGLKPSASQGEARLRGLERIIYSKTIISVAVWRRDVGCGHPWSVQPCPTGSTIVRTATICHVVSLAGADSIHTDERYGMTVETKTNGKPQVNRIGLTSQDYRGGETTLCQGCGHNSITSQIIAAAFELSLAPHQVIKMSGIGCSSKTPAYFMSRSHGFNTLHGRMPSVTTGAVLANRTLLAIGISGDGDTGSIGLGQFKHMVRRNVPVVYIVENNGVYGLTKGQFSATADVGQTLKYAGTNVLPPIDICIEALAADCGFVARSFAGDAKQVRELLKAAMSFHGTAVIDIISPCVTFNNHHDSTKSYDYGKAHEERLQDIQFIPRFDEVHVDYDEGDERYVQLHDGPMIKLRKLGRDYDPTNKWHAIELLERARQNHEFITGLLYINTQRQTLHEVMHLTSTPLAYLPEEELRPSRERFERAMQEFV